MLGGISLLAGLGGLALGYGFRPDVDLDAPAAEQLAGIAASTGEWRLAFVLLLLGAALCVPGALALVPLVRREGDPNGLAGAGLVALGAVALIAHAAAFGFQGASLAEGSTDPARAAGAVADYHALLDGVLGTAHHGASVLAVGFVVLGVLLNRRGPEPRHAGLVMALGAGLLVVGDLNDIPKVAAAGAGVIIIGAVSFAFARPAEQE